MNYMMADEATHARIMDFFSFFLFFGGVRVEVKSSMMILTRDRNYWMYFLQHNKQYSKGYMSLNS